MRRREIVAVGAAVPVAVLLAAGCQLDLGRASCGGDLPSGRTVAVASARFWRSVSSESLSPDTAAARIGSRTLVVAPTAVGLDGMTVATIPADARAVTVAEAAGRLRVVADGRTVYEADY